MTMQPRVVVTVVTAMLLTLPATAQSAQRGTPHEGSQGVERTTADLNAATLAAGPRSRRTLPRRINRARAGLEQQGPVAAGSADRARGGGAEPRIAVTGGFGFEGPSLPDSLSFPPDTMGAVGPTQFIAAMNGRFRSYDKTTGAPDGALNVDPNIFFAPVLTPVAGTFTTDPRIRYDRLAQRWIIVMIDVPDGGASENRVMVARSDGPAITPATVWTYFFFVSDAGGPDDLFADYPTLGVDANALYIGANMFSFADSLVKTNMYVVRKSSILGAGPLVVTRFDGAFSGTSGPYTPQGVDNFDPAATTGYFVGVDNDLFGRLVVRIVGNPGGTPSISADQVIGVPPTASPISVEHLGNAGGPAGRLDGIDDRLFSAQLRNGRLWTAHNVGVDAAGNATAAATRNATRWYEISVAGVPSLVQSGTLFDPAEANPRNYWIPALAVNGQGVMAIGGSVAGGADRVDAWFSGRVPGDPAGQLDPPTQYTATPFTYNPPGDTGASRGHRRWGDYSMTTIDPDDDQTFWTIQEYVTATNTWGTRIARLTAPPPATPASTTPVRVLRGQPSVAVTLSGTSVAGSAFFDSGAGVAKKMQVAVGCGIAVNGATLTGPTTIALNLNTAAATAGACPVTVVNPDGQSATAAVLRTNLAPSATADRFTIDQGTTLTAPSVLANDADADTDALVAVPDAPPARGTLALQPNGTFVYRPAASFSGTDSFVYHASDGFASSPGVKVDITVRRLSVSFAGFPRTLTVARTGRFTFRFKATAGRSAKITFTSRARVRVGSRVRKIVIGPKSFKVPSAGRVAFKTRLSATQLRALRTKKRLTFDVKVVIGQRTFKSKLVLRAPKRR